MIRLLILLLPIFCFAEDHEADGRLPPLLTIHRVHVEKLTGGETAEQIRDMIIAKLQNTGLFVLTENPDRADAFLRGSAEDLIFTDQHDTRDGVTARGTLRLGSSSSSSSSTKGAFYSSASVGEDEASRIVERRHEAMAAVRIVDANGDVIWSTVQESKGGKFTGASADVADRITKQLVRDVEDAKDRFEGPESSPSVVPQDR